MLRFIIVAKDASSTSRETRSMRDYMKSIGMEPPVVYEYTEGLAAIYTLRIEKDCGMKIQITANNLPFVMVEKNGKIRFYRWNAVRAHIIEALERRDEY